MVLQFIAWLGTASLIYALILGTHALRTRFSLAPVYVVIGFVASSMMWLSELQARVEIGGLTIMWGSTLFAGLMMAIFVLYLFDGSAAARMGILANCAVTLASYGLAAILLTESANGLTKMGAEVEMLSARPYFASAGAALIDFIFLCVVWELLRGQRVIRGQLPRIFLTLLATLWLDAWLYVPLGYGFGAEYLSSISGNMLDRFILCAWVAPALSMYVNWQSKLYGADLGRGRVFSILEGGAASEYELAVAKKEIERRVDAERALRDSEEQFRTLVESIPGITFRCLYDNDWTMLYMSDAVEEITGYPASDFIRNRVRSFASIIHPDDEQMVSNVVAEAYRSREPYSVGYRIIRKDGEVRWLGERGQVTYGDEGQARWLDGVISDVTERRMAEEQIQRYAFIANSVSDMMSFVTADYVYEAVNDAWCEMAGKSREEAIGQPVGAIWGNSVFYRSIQDNIDRCLKGRVVRFRDWIEFGAAGRRYCQTMLYPYRDSSGAVTHAVIVTRDITEEKRAQQTIEENERRFRAIFDQTGQLMAIVDEQGRIQDINRAAEEFAGRGKVHWIGGELAEVPGLQNDGENAGKFREAIHASIGGRTVQFETRAHDARGDMHLFEVTITPIRDETNEVEFLIASANDVTHRRQIEAALQESERHFRAVFENAGIGIVSAGADGGIIRANDTFLRMTGYTWEEVRNRTFVEFSHPEDRERIEEMLAAQRTGDRGLVEIETRYLQKEGSAIWVDLRSTSIHDEAGRVMVSVTTFADVTKRKLAEERVREQDRNMRRLIDVSPIAMAIPDKDGKIVYANNKFVDLFQYGYREVPTMKQWWALAYPEPEYRQWVEGEWSACLREAEQQGEAHPLESRVTCKDGSVRHIEMRVASIGDSILVLFNDLTERKLAAEELARAKEAAEEANRAKSEFLATMSHEIRTPMNAILGMAHLALRTRLDDQQQDYVSKMQSAAQSLLGIINDILDFSKIEAGRMELEHVPFNLDEVLNTLANVASARACDKPDLELLYQVDPDAPRHLIGDPMRLGQILTNLVSNAIKFTEEGEIVVSAEVENISDGEAKLNFAVRDTGIGLSESQMARLFQPFTQADSSTTRKYGGTGLGLTICKRLIRLMDGDLEVESEPNKGSTFRFSARFGIHAADAGHGWDPTGQLKSLRVLIADDNATSRAVLNSMVRAFTDDVVVVDDAEHALTELQRANENETFDLILMDWRMPGMDGIDAAQHIRGDSRYGKTPFVILVTAYGREEVNEKAEQAGIDAVLLKPVSQSTLVDTILGVFGKRLGPPVVTRPASDGEDEVREILRGARVLLVEDNEINRQVAREMLRNAGLSVVSAVNGYEAVNAVQEESFDVVLMDVQMPRMDGYEATQAIREDPRFHDLPIIAMTANTMAGDREKCLEAGMNDHISKPVAPTNLYSTLLRWIRADAAAAVTSEATVSSAPIVKTGNKAAPLIDAERARTMLGGNNELFFDLLSKFVERYPDTALTLREQIASENLSEASRLAHSIKGVAGYLAADQLYEAAGRIERFLNRGETPSAMDTMPLFSQTLEGTVEAASALITGRERAMATERPQGSVDQLADVLQSLMPLLRQRRPAPCRPCLEILQTHAWPAPFRAQVEDVCTLTSRYRFPQALQAAEIILESITHGEREGT